MLERQTPRVKELPVEVEVLLQSATTVQGVAHHGVADVGHVHANLMGTASVQLAFQQRVPVVLAACLKALKHSEGRE